MFETFDTLTQLTKTPEALNDPLPSAYNLKQKTKN